MSLILEALKKSENQRRLGESPSLGSPVMAVRRRRSLLPPLVALIAVGLAVYWLLNRTPDLSAPTTTKQSPAESAESAEPAAADAKVGTITGSGTSTVHTTSKDREPVTSLASERMPHSKVPADSTASLPPDLRERVKSGEVVVANPQLLKPGQPATIKESEAITPNANTMLVTGSGADKAMPKTAETPAAEPLVQDPAVAKTSVKAAPVEQKAMNTAPPVAAPPAAVAPATPSFALVWELPYAVRRELPELKLTMHVFAAQPAQRFVIVNGNRQIEGDDIDGLRLVEIRPDGIIFEHKGLRFLYPRGGR